MSATAPSFETHASGTIQRFGNGRAQSGVTINPGRTQREVHPSRRDETISYKIEHDTLGLRFEVPARLGREAEQWEHYLYRFTYRYLGRTISVTWRCGTQYGEPQPLDGLNSMFRDIGWIDSGEEMSDAEHGALWDLNERMRVFFDNDTERELWENILTGLDNQIDGFTSTTYERP